MSSSERSHSWSARACVRLAVSLIGVWALVSVFASAAWSADGWTLYVTNEGGGTATTIDTATNATEGTAIVVGTSPTGIAITPDGKVAYVANNGAVSPISTVTNTAGTAISAGSGPLGVAVTPDGKTAYVANISGDAVTPINIATNTAGAPIPVGSKPFWIAITPDGKTAYVTDSGTNTVTPINIATDTAGTAITVGPSPEGIAITPDGKTAYVANSDTTTVTPINLATNTAGAAITVGLNPEGIAITPNGKTAYVANVDSDTVSPIDTASNTAGAAIAVGHFPVHLAITPDGKTVYVANSGSNTVTPINTATNDTGTAIMVGSMPYGLAITPDQAPTAAFSVAAGAAGSPSTFDGSTSSSLVGSIASYRWDFGDGASTATATTTPMTTHVYATPGTYTARLTVTDGAGSSLAQVFTGQTVSLQGGPQATINHTVTVLPAPMPAAVVPTLTRVAQSHSTWREGNRLAAFAKRARKRPPVGTTFSFVLNESARVALVFSQQAAGRRVKGSCVGQTSKNRRKPACRRRVARGTLAFSAHAGLNVVAFQGRISASQKLKPGRYTLSISATNAAGQRSSTSRLGFMIVR